MTDPKEINCRYVSVRCVVWLTSSSLIFQAKDSWRKTIWTSTIDHQHCVLTLILKHQNTAEYYNLIRKNCKYSIEPDPIKHSKKSCI